MYDVFRGRMDNFEVGVFCNTFSGGSMLRNLHGV